MFDTILADKTLKSKSQEDDYGNENVNENGNENVNESLNLNGNDETLMSSDKDDDYDDENKNENENEDDDETIKYLNDLLDEIIDKSKSFEEQIKLLEKVDDLEEYWFMKDYDDNKLKFKKFKLRLAHMSNEIDKKLFTQIFGHKLKTLANKLINTTNKEENQIIVNNINKNKDKLYEQDDFSDDQNDQHINLIDAVDLILNFNETIQLDLV